MSCDDVDPGDPSPSFIPNANGALGIFPPLCFRLIYSI